MPQLDFPREWFTFFNPDDAEEVYRCDITWLMSSWTCIFGNGCHGIERTRPDDGCCSHGAFFSDDADEKRVRRMAKELTKEDWQFRAEGRKNGITEEDDGRTRTRLHEGACVFINRPGFAGGAGCALHRRAWRTPSTRRWPSVGRSAVTASTARRTRTWPGRPPSCSACPPTAPR